MNGSWANMYQDKQYRKPDSVAAMGLLSHLNADELREVLNDDKKFEELIKDVKELKDIETEKEILIVSNRSLAEFNLSQEPILLKEKGLVQDLSEEGGALSQSVEEKMRELSGKSGSSNLETALALLQAAAAEMEEESDAIAEKFLEGESDVDTFLDQFTSRRKLMHLRKVKTDKMSEMVNRRSSVQSNINHVQTNLSNSSFYQAPHPPAPSGLPYPVGPIGMPMPSMYAQSHFG